MKMYKWFVWSSKLLRYVAVPGLFPECRGDYPAIMLDRLFRDNLPNMFSIPMFNTHSPAKRVF